MAKVKNSKKTYTIYCLACKTTHNINCNPELNGPWVFSGTTTKPTFKPACKLQYKDESGALFVCHFRIDQGEIEYLKDCTHKFAGVIMDLPDVKM